MPEGGVEMPDKDEAPRAPVPVTIGPKGALAHMDLRGHGNFVQVADFGTHVRCVIV
jgi:hypothetical protein